MISTRSSLFLALAVLPVTVPTSVPRSFQTSFVWKFCTIRNSESAPALKDGVLLFVPETILVLFCLALKFYTAFMEIPFAEKMALASFKVSLFVYGSGAFS